MKRNNLIIAALSLAALLLGACATPRGAYKAGYDFSKINTVKVGSFTSSANQPNSGSVVANEFMRQLLSAGYAVSTADAAAPSDVILEGSVTEYLPNNRYLVQDPRASTAANVVVVQPTVQISGSAIYQRGTVFGLEGNNQIIVSNATVGVSAYLKDAATGEIIWSNTFTYEGLDLTTALEGAVHYLLRSMPKDTPKKN